MTVRELIQALRLLDPDLICRIPLTDGSCYYVDSARKGEDNDGDPACLLECS